MDRVQMLKGVPLFAGLGPQQLEELARLLQEEEVSAQHVVVRQGEPGDRFWVVKEGKLKVSLRDASGGEVIVATLGPGSYFGEMALLGNQPRTATVTALSPTRLLGMGRKHFEDFLTTNPAAVLELLRTVAMRQQENQAALLNTRLPAATSEPPRTIVLVDTKGGVGRTTLAVNLALALRLSTGKRVALVDCSLQFGDVGLLLNLNSTRSISDLLPLLAGSADDAEALVQNLINHDSGLKVLLAPPRPELADLISAEHIKTLLERMTLLFDYIVVDAPLALQETSLTLFDVANVILVVVTPELAALKNARMLLDTVEKLGYGRDAFSVVVNRVDSAAALRLDDMARVLNRPLTLTVANDWKAASEARKQGTPSVLLDKNSRLSRSVFALARQVATRAEKKS